MSTVQDYVARRLDNLLPEQRHLPPQDSPILYCGPAQREAIFYTRYVLDDLLMHMEQVKDQACVAREPGRVYRGFLHLPWPAAHAGNVAKAFTPVLGLMVVAQSHSAATSCS